jgi:hypothetical protein
VVEEVAQQARKIRVFLDIPPAPASSSSSLSDEELSTGGGSPRSLANSRRSARRAARAALALCLRDRVGSGTGAPKRALGWCDGSGPRSSSEDKACSGSTAVTRVTPSSVRAIIPGGSWGPMPRPAPPDAGSSSTHTRTHNDSCVVGSRQQQQQQQHTDIHIRGMVRPEHVTPSTKAALGALPARALAATSHAPSPVHGGVPSGTEGFTEGT